MGKITYAVNNDFLCEDLATALKGFFQEKGMESQCFEKEKGNYIVQAKSKDSYLRKIAGVEKACTVSLKVESRVLHVEIGEDKWLDKMAGAAIAWFITWPVLLTTAYGTYKQLQLPKEIDAFIQIYLGTEPMTYLTANEVGNAQKFCYECGASKEEQAKFCPNCGTKF